MGMVNYLSKFSSRLAALCSGIHEVTGSRSEWFWGPAQQTAYFEEIKEVLVNARYYQLCAFDPTKNQRVSSDASKNALGAVLLQETRPGVWQWSTPPGR